MSDAKATQQEPSMEEILASIRRIISEDSDGGKPAAPAPVEAPPSEPDKGEVLELTEMVEEDGAVVDIKPPPQVPPPPEPLLPPPEPPPARVEPPQPMISDEALISTPTASASAAVLSNLRGFSRDSDMRGQPLIGGGITVEELVRQEVRPMLREWLDQNLTTLVERLVDREIRRLSRDADQS